MNRELRETFKRYRQFREAEPDGIRKVSVAPPPKALWRLGICEFIGYMTTHQGKPALYVHHFAPGSRPVLVASVRRNGLYLMGGRFRVTDRGITDLTATGHETDFRPRYDINPRRPRRRKARR